VSASASQTRPHVERVGIARAPGIAEQGGFAACASPRHACPLPPLVGALERERMPSYAGLAGHLQPGGCTLATFAQYHPCGAARVGRHASRDVHQLDAQAGGWLQVVRRTACTPAQTALSRRSNQIMHPRSPLQIRILGFEDGGGLDVSRQMVERWLGLSRETTPLPAGFDSGATGFT
jgi:hypothetical protein